MQYTMKPVEKFEALFRAAASELDGPAQRLRTAAFDRLARTGFPTQRHEEWRYTNLHSVLETPYADAEARAAVDPSALLPYPFLADAAHVLTFIDGSFSSALSRVSTLPGGVIVESISRRLAADPQSLLERLDSTAPSYRTPFTELNSAFATDGAWVHVPRNTVVEQPIFVLFLSRAIGEATVSYPRILITAERGASVSVVETHASLGDGAHLTVAQTEIAADDAASVDLTRLQLENESARHISTTLLQQRSDCACAVRTVTLGGALVRNDIGAVLDGEHGGMTLDGLYLARGTQHIDTHTVIDHAMPNCASQETYKGVMDDAARGAFSGRIIVRPDAQKTDARQSNNNLLLSENASADSKPQLEIFADDVRCTHGATVGRLDDDAIFYLQARGIRKEEARRILTAAFASDVISRIAIPSVRAYLDTMLQQRLQPSFSTRP